MPRSPGLLWHVSVRVAPEAEEAVAECFARRFQTPASTYHDLRRGQVTVSVHLPKLPSPPAAVARSLRADLRSVAACGLDLRPGTVNVKPLRQRDWSEAWKRHAPPMEVGRALLIRPSWSRRRARTGQQMITLDPGLSFGTGHHPTTLFCLEQLVKCRLQGLPQTMLDVGTGSGLLAIAAARLGYERIQAFDFDPIAVRVALANARRNRAAGRVRIYRQDVRRLRRVKKPAFDVVCANLTADLILAESARLAAQVRPGGSLLLAGILRPEMPAVLATFKRLGFVVQRGLARREWASVHLRNRVPDRVS